MFGLNLNPFKSAAAGEDVDEEMGLSVVIHAVLGVCNSPPLTE